MQNLSLRWVFLLNYELKYLLCSKRDCRLLLLAVHKQDILVVQYKSYCLAAYCIAALVVTERVYM